jgi:hypothetical protein
MMKFKMFEISSAKRAQICTILFLSSPSNSIQTDVFSETLTSHDRVIYRAVNSNFHEEASTHVHNLPSKELTSERLFFFSVME